jgi:hypothetical protein
VEFAVNVLEKSGRIPTIPYLQLEAADNGSFLAQFAAGIEKPSADPALAVFCQTLFASAEFRYTY